MRHLGRKVRGLTLLAVLGLGGLYLTAICSVDASVPCCSREASCQRGVIAACCDEPLALVTPSSLPVSAATGFAGPARLDPGAMATLPRVAPAAKRSALLLGTTVLRL